MQLKPALQGLSRVRIILLVEIKHAEVVISGGQMRSELDHCSIFLNSRGIVIPLLSSLRLGIELLYLRSNFVISRLRQPRKQGCKQEPGDHDEPQS